MMRARNSLAQPMNNFVFQAAVPKSFQLNLQAQSASAVLPHNSGEVSQQININNPQRVSGLRTAQAPGFPPTLL